MKISPLLPRSPRELIQKRLMTLTVLFLFSASLALTFAPAVRFHTLQTALKWQHWIGFSVWLSGFFIFFWQADRVIPHRDPYLMPLAGLMSGWGLITQFRLDPTVGFKQTIWLAICLLAVATALRIPGLLNLLRRYKYIWLTAALILAILTFFLGTNPSGSGPNLWLGFAGIYLQPSEILKLVLVIYLAAYLADNVPAHFRFLQLVFPTLLVAGISLMILIMQRDLGTASLFIALYTVIIYLASGKRRFLLISFLVIISALIAGYLVFDVIQLRVEAWLNPWKDANGRSYQIVQSIIAIANGGIFGRGIGLGSPGVVPVASSDFIFPSMIEETGLLGALAIVLLYGILTVRGFFISLRAPNQFQRFLAAGITTYFISQALLIMGGTIRLLPLTGVTLPFFSYGGSSLLVAFFAMLLLLMISHQCVEDSSAVIQTRAYFFSGTVFLFALMAVFLVCSWWGIFRAENLVERNDNPRRFISDQYVQRGKILDRNNTILAETIGETGGLTRILNYPSLSAVVGYSNMNYGQGGLEATLDTILRGVTGNTFENIFQARLLNSQYPVGADIRISLDINLQLIADDLMADQKGGLVMVNAKTGEILVMSTSPTFDANFLEENWETWKESTDSPLLNRTTQGLYPVGTATGGLLLGSLLASDTLPPSPEKIEWSSELNAPQYCASIPQEETWTEMISAGCTSSFEMLNYYLGPVEVQTIYKQSGLFDNTDNYTSEGETDSVILEKDTQDNIYETRSLLVSPLQMAIAYAPLSNSGVKIIPQLAIAYHYPQQDWILFSKEEMSSPLLNLDADQAGTSLSNTTIPGWQLNASAKTETGRVDWFIAGTHTTWKGTPVIIVVALEDAAPSIAKHIGRKMFDATINSVR